ncbi:MFS general substrate transporter [Periconia macrospinosa]|uniref:MFS general substrate transporter n=1 Tax=Periconia macrospinosa TaxID=97972 RepID=A0A2V1DES5_9PLEO|nr:MFS general substrate transporter [Periconia macrospinosa]
MAGDIENLAGTAAPDPNRDAVISGSNTPRNKDESSSGANTPPDKSEKEMTAQEIEALKTRAILENEARNEQLTKQKGPTIPAASFWMRKEGNEFFDQVATQPSVFDDPMLAPHFQPHPKYENLHRFDPTERWTWGEEMKVTNRIDLKITIWACIAFFGLDLGRGNLSQANSADFLEDLGMGTNDYNTGVTIFQISFLLAEIPSQMISKKIGPDRWIPFISCSWAIVCGAQFFLSGRASFFATRALIGMLQGGFIPDVVLYLTYFFKSTELPFRLSLFWAVRRITDIVAPILAFGILRMDGIQGREGWRWMFLIEGFIMLSIGTWSWFMMVPSPTQTKAWHRPKGWFTEREEKILVNRVLRDDPTKGDMHNRQAITLKALWKAFCDFDLWPIYLFALIWEMPAGPPDQYLTITLRRLGFDTFQTNLLTIPAQAGAAVTIVIMTWMSEHFDQRAIFGAFTQIWMLPCVVALLTMPAGAFTGDGGGNVWSVFAVTTVLLSFPSPHAIHVSWASRNSHSVRTRAISTALYNMIVQLSRVIHANIYREEDEPIYRNGNRALVGICIANICIYAGGRFYYMWRNKSKARKWGAMTREEQSHYLATTSQTGSKRLDTRFKY